MKHLFFFGCGNLQKGHYLFNEDDRHIRNEERMCKELGINVALLTRSIDSQFCPVLANQNQGIYKVSIVPPMMIMSWWDRTGDPRPGSNSNLIGVGYTNPIEIIEDARKQFPKTMGRQPKLEPES
jgi:hypothetical protein